MSEKKPRLSKETKMLIENIRNDTTTSQLTKNLLEVLILRNETNNNNMVELFIRVDNLEKSLKDPATDKRR